MRKEMKLWRRYFIINIDEPYAEEIFKVLKRGQMAKDEWPEGDISFAEWREQTFGQLREQCISEIKNYEIRVDEGKMYEDELPEDLPQSLYDQWFGLSSIVHGVRMGPVVRVA